MVKAGFQSQNTWFDGILIQWTVSVGLVSSSSETEPKLSKYAVSCVSLWSIRIENSPRGSQLHYWAWRLEDHWFALGTRHQLARRLKLQNSSLMFDCCKGGILWLFEMESGWEVWSWLFNGSEIQSILYSRLWIFRWETTAFFVRGYLHNQKWDWEPEPNRKTVQLQKKGSLIGWSCHFSRPFVMLPPCTSYFSASLNNETCSEHRNEEILTNELLFLFKPAWRSSQTTCCV